MPTWNVTVVPELITVRPLSENESGANTGDPSELVAIGGRPGEPPGEHVGGLGRPEVEDEVAQHEHAARPQHVGDPLQRDRLEEVRDLVQRASGEERRRPACGRTRR